MKQFLRAFVDLDNKADKFEKAKKGLVEAYKLLSEEEKLVTNSTPMDIKGIKETTVGEFVATMIHEKPVEVVVETEIVEETPIEEVAVEDVETDSDIS